MSTTNDNKKGMSNTTFNKSDSSKDQTSGGKKGMEQKDEKKPEASKQTRNDKDSDTQNK